MQESHKEKSERSPASDGACQIAPTRLLEAGEVNRLLETWTVATLKAVFTGATSRLPCAAIVGKLLDLHAGCENASKLYINYIRFLYYISIKHFKTFLHETDPLENE